MSNIAIRVENLSKKFHIGKKQERYSTLRDTLVQVATAPFQRIQKLISGNAAGVNDLSEEIWALKDVSFEVQHGDVVGIIGRNGAGKSTLLKILSQITEPTSGRIEMYGRVGALLEVGTGFHPELTGRENVFLNGAILGMTRREIERKFDEIVDFSGVEKFIDTPVKHFSSGMQMRLAFAVAANLEPEILIVDEVLAVGDAEFQKKCLGKMDEVAKGGRTVLFVSHNLAAVGELCQKGMLLESGNLIYSGTTQVTLKKYIDSNVGTNKSTSDSSVKTGIFLEKISVVHQDSQLIKCELFIRSDNEISCGVNIIFKNTFGASIGFATIGSLGGDMVFLAIGNNHLLVDIDISNIALGNYQIHVDICKPSQYYYFRSKGLFELDISYRLPKKNNTIVLDSNWGLGWFEMPAKLNSVQKDDVNVF